MYVKASWSLNNKGTIIRIGSLVEGVDWSDCARQCEVAYPDYTLETMYIVPFAIDPWDSRGDVYICGYTDQRGKHITIYVLATSLVQAWEQVLKFEPNSIESIRKTDTNYKTKE